MKYQCQWGYVKATHEISVATYSQTTSILHTVCWFNPSTNVGMDIPLFGTMAYNLQYDNIQYIII